MSRAGKGRLRPTWRAVAIGVLTALALGVLLGGLLTPSHPERAPTPASGGARSIAGVPVSFPRSRAGAAAAVAAYQRALAGPALLRPGVLRARIEAIASPDYAAQMLAANTPGAQRLAAGPLGQGLRLGVETVFAAVPIGYRLEAYRPDRATVLTWGLTLLGNASTLAPSAYFGLSHTDVAWLQGRWQITQTRSGFGPTPRLAMKPGPLGPYRVIDLLGGLRSYALAP